MHAGAGLPWIPKRDILSYEEIVRIVEAAAAVGVRSIRLTGGEPLIRRDLVALVRSISAIPGIDNVALSTNALLLADLARPLAEAGLRRVNVSLDTLREDRFATIARRPGLERVLAGIDAALAAGLEPLKLNCVVMRGQNDDEVVAFAELSRERRVHVRFIEMMPVVDNLPLQRAAYVSADEILARIRATAGVDAGARSRRERAGALLQLRRCRRHVRRDQPALTRLLRDLQPGAALGRRPAAALPLRGSRDRPADAAAFRRDQRADRRALARLGCTSSRSATTCSSATRPAPCGPSRRSAAS